MPPFSADADARFVVPAASKARGAAGADPVIAAAVLFLLFLDALVEHLHQFIQFFDKPIHARLIIEITFELVLAEPVPEFLRQILRRLDAFKVLGEDRVQLVVIRLRLDENAAAEMVKARQRGMRQILAHRFHQRHPFVDRNLQAAGPQQIEKIQKHVYHRERE